jgi:signal peptidase
VGRVVAWTAILGFVAAIGVAVVVPRLGGGTPYAILTGSMRPGMPPGTLVVVRPAAPESLGLGDVITYQLSSGEPTVVTHRIVSVAIKADGQRTFRTQGDANDVVDQEPVLPVQVRGKLWYSVPRLGYVNRYVNGDQRETATLLVALGLCAYAGAMLLGSLREDRLRARPVPAHRRRPFGGTP